MIVGIGIGIDLVDIGCMARIYEGFGAAAERFMYLQGTPVHLNITDELAMAAAMVVLENEP